MSLQRTITSASAKAANPWPRCPWLVKLVAIHLRQSNFRGNLICLQVSKDLWSESWGTNQVLTTRVQNKDMRLTVTSDMPQGSSSAFCGSTVSSSPFPHSPLHVSVSPSDNLELG